MTDNTLDKPALRATLLAQQHSLTQVERTGDEAAATVELDQSRVGRLSRMDAMQAQAMSVETRRRRAIKLRQIAIALKRLDADDYGVCDECGELIATARIEYDPAAILCIGCASANEQR